MSPFSRIAAVVAFAISLTGCSSGPSDSDIEAALTSDNGQSFVEISNIERLNGYADGEHKYVVEVSYTTTFLSSYEEVAAGASGFERMALGMFTLLVGEWDKGDSFEEQQRLVFVDSENGWIVP